MDREAEILQQRVEVLPFERRRARRASNGFEVMRMKARKAMVTAACTASVLARSRAGMLSRDSATTPPNSARIRTHSSIEPSWFPHTPVTL